MQNGATGVQKLVVASLLTLFTCSQGLLMEGSKVGGEYPYQTAVVPFLSEMLKLGMSAILLRWQLSRNPKKTKITRGWGTAILFPVPSIIYLVHNNVQFYTMSYVDAATYQILGNLKIVSTGLLSWLFLRKHLSMVQWYALILLMCGAATSQIQGCGEGCNANGLAAPVQGYVLGVVSACLSAVAGVYTEFIMKKNDDSLYWQNMQLYAWGSIFNAAALTLRDLKIGFREGFWLLSLTKGFNLATYLLVLNLGCAGLFISWIMKFGDNIVKVYATSSAMLLTTLISAWLFALQPTLQLLLGIVVAAISLQLYFLPLESLSNSSVSRTGLHRRNSSKSLDSRHSEKADKETA